jgi:uncharacterized protein (TIGR02246 family)
MTMSADELELRRMIDDWRGALERGDADDLVRNYAEDALLFDVKPPYKVVGREAIRQLWLSCLPFFPEKFQAVHRDQQLQVVGDMASFHALFAFIIDDATDHPAAQTWLRVTVIYRKIGGSWKVVHEHVSLPYNPCTNEIAFIKDPDDLLCGVDYAQCNSDSGAG